MSQSLQALVYKMTLAPSRAPTLPGTVWAFLQLLTQNQETRLLEKMLYTVGERQRLKRRNAAIWPEENQFIQQGFGLDARKNLLNFKAVKTQEAGQ